MSNVGAPMLTGSQNQKERKPKLDDALTFLDQNAEIVKAILDAWASHLPLLDRVLEFLLKRHARTRLLSWTLSI
jgi:hypothetical protein